MHDQAIGDNEDDLLVTRCRGGDRTAFNRLVLRYQDRIIALCARMLSDRVSGEDAAQETFVKAYRNIGTFKGEARFSTWLYTIATNCCRNQQRSWWQRLKRLSVRSYDDEDRETPAYEVPDTGPSPAEIADQRDTTRHLLGALRKLPIAMREIVVLRDIQGLSYEEIEAVTSLPSGTVKSRLARARTSLRLGLKGIVDAA